MEKIIHVLYFLYCFRYINVLQLSIEQNKILQYLFNCCHGHVFIRYEKFYATCGKIMYSPPPFPSPQKMTIIFQSKCTKWKLLRPSLIWFIPYTNLGFHQLLLLSLIFWQKKIKSINNYKKKKYFMCVTLKYFQSKRTSWFFFHWLYVKSAIL